MTIMFIGRTCSGCKQTPSRRFIVLQRHTHTV